MIEFICLIGAVIRIIAEIIGLFVIVKWIIKKIKQQKCLLEDEITKTKLIKELKLKYKYDKISDKDLKSELYQLETL